MKHLLKKVLFLFIAFGLLAPASYATSNLNGDPIEAKAKEALKAPSINEAIANLKTMSKAEKKLKAKELKKAVKEFKQQKKAGAEPSTNTLLLVILAILLPPLAVYLHQGEINNKFWISLLLTLLFFLPGVIYAIIVVTGND